MLARISGGRRMLRREGITNINPPWTRLRKIANIFIMNEHKPHTLPKQIIYLFLLIGLTAAVAFRLIIVFNNINPDWVRPTWYLGVIANIMFFLYRYYISYKRKKAISDFRLIEILKNNEPMTKEQQEVLYYLVLSLKKSRENINYLFIFAMSIVAIAVDLSFVLFS